jgi:hypothetical protein
MAKISHFLPFLGCVEHTPYTPVGGGGGGVHPEVGKVALKSYSDEAFKDEFLLKSHGHEALSKDSL